MTKMELGSVTEESWSVNENGLLTKTGSSGTDKRRLNNLL